MLYLAEGFASLIMPNPYMVGELRFFHGIEIFLKNFTRGIVIAYPFAPK
jgi:hypothetical protein